MNNYAIILAGGIGSRLWPISSRKKPKQFLKLYSDDIMINITIKRIKNIFSYKNIFVVINDEQKDMSMYIDKNIPKKNIIIEPKAKNTTMCIFYVTLIINQLRGKGITTILSSDHYIKNVDLFTETIQKGIDIANKESNLVTIGIKPIYPSTEFGYIKYHCAAQKDYYLVDEFKEKPNYEKANEYINSKKYYWNSGIFIWNTDVILNKLKLYVPEIYKYRNKIEKNIGNYSKILNIYNKVDSISIDKSVLEKVEDIKMIKGKFKWMDIGTINDWFKIKKRDKCSNIKIGNAIIKTSNNINLYNSDTDKLIVTMGVENLNIINCNNVILITNKNETKNISSLIKELQKTEKYKEFL